MRLDDLIGSVPGVVWEASGRPDDLYQRIDYVSDYVETMLRPFDFSEISATPADAPFSGKLQLEVGGREIRLTEMGPAHTAGDLVVYVPDAKMAFAGVPSYPSSADKTIVQTLVCAQVLYPVRHLLPIPL